jgi:hypothetical protein
MLKHLRIVLFIAATNLFSQSPAGSENVLDLTFFGSSTCEECMRIREELLLPLEQQYAGKLKVHINDVESDSGLRELLRFEKSFHISSDAAQMLFFPDTFLSGFDDIMKMGRAMTETRLTSGGVMINKAAGVSGDNIDLNGALHDRAFNLGFFLGTLATGLADGVNPCAIATMIFLISFLATRKRSRTEVLLIGLTYTATVFLTYLAMGLGLKGVLEHIKGYHLISSIIRWGAFGTAVIVAVLSFKDAITFHRSKNTDKITLQLPKVVKLRIHKIISGNLSGRSLLIGAIITGFLVTLLEAICTGQMYIPYIVAMTQNSSLRFAGYFYLAFYNFLFVLPLLIVMVLAYFGLKWNDLAKQTQKKMVLLKVLLGIVMTALAVYLAVGSGFVG